MRQGHIGRVDGALQEVDNVASKRGIVLTDLLEQTLLVLALHGGLEVGLGDEVGDDARVLGGVTFLHRRTVGERSTHVHQDAGLQAAHTGDIGSGTVGGGGGGHGVDRELLTPEGIILRYAVRVVEDEALDSAAFLRPKSSILG